MVELNLTSEEQNIMRDVLGQVLAELRMEIADTDSMDFRERLKRRKATIQKVLDAFPAAKPQA